MANELDRELERQGFRFIRYADDFCLYTKTKAEAHKVGNTTFKFPKDTLKLIITGRRAEYADQYNSLYWVSGLCPPM
jgi:RNA-directed DNA polymerase